MERMKTELNFSEKRKESKCWEKCITMRIEYKFFGLPAASVPSWGTGYLNYSALSACYSVDRGFVAILLHCLIWLFTHQ